MIDPNEEIKKAIAEKMDDVKAELTKAIKHYKRLTYLSLVGSIIYILHMLFTHIIK